MPESAASINVNIGRRRRRRARTHDRAVAEPELGPRRGTLALGACKCPGAAGPHRFTHRELEMRTPRPREPATNGQPAAPRGSSSKSRLAVVAVCGSPPKIASNNCPCGRLPETAVVFTVGSRRHRRRDVDRDEARVLADEVMRERDAHDLRADVLGVRAGDLCIGERIDLRARPQHTDARRLAVAERVAAVVLHACRRVACRTSRRSPSDAV